MEEQPGGNSPRTDRVRRASRQGEGGTGINLLKADFRFLEGFFRCIYSLILAQTPPVVKTIYCKVFFLCYQLIERGANQGVMAASGALVELSPLLTMPSSHARRRRTHPRASEPSGSPTRAPMDPVRDADGSGQAALSPPNPENKLFVGGAPPGTDEDTLRKIFVDHGQVEEVFVMRGGSRSGQCVPSHCNPLPACVINSTAKPLLQIHA